VDSGLKGATSAAALTPQVRDLIRDVEAATGAPVTLLDTGPRPGDMIELA
jgi:adenylosuccinate synthase